jgi:hypothetical protein
VVAVHRRQQRIGLGVLRRQLLKQVGDLLARQHQDHQERRHSDEPADIEVGDPLDRPAGERVLGRRPQLSDKPDERALVAGLLRDLVEHVGGARIGHPTRLGDLEREAGVQHRLEAKAHLEHRRYLFSGEAGAGLRIEVEVEPTDAEQLVTDHLPRTECAPVEQLLGLEDLADRGGREPVDSCLRGGIGRSSSHAASVAPTNQ